MWVLIAIFAAGATSTVNGHHKGPVCPPQCPANETYSECKMQCPTNFCPVDDSLAVVICDPPSPCPDGCICSLGYKMKSEKERGCILAEECPPVKCTRPNECWNPCPSCLAESCEDVNNPPSVCNEFVHNCQPRCVCEQGYYRNNKGICVCPEECDVKCED